MWLPAWAPARGAARPGSPSACFGLDCLKMLQAAGQGAVNAPPGMDAGTVIWLLALAGSVLLFTGASSRHYRPNPRPVTSWHRTCGTR